MIALTSWFFLGLRIAAAAILGGTILFRDMVSMAPLMLIWDALVLLGMIAVLVYPEIRRLRSLR